MIDGTAGQTRQAPTNYREYKAGLDGEVGQPIFKPFKLQDGGFGVISSLGLKKDNHTQRLIVTIYDQDGNRINSIKATEYQLDAGLLNQ